MKDHNAGRVPWTSAHKPLQLIYFEFFKCIELAKNEKDFLRLGKAEAY